MEREEANSSHWLKNIDFGAEREEETASDELCELGKKK